MLVLVMERSWEWNENYLRISRLITLDGATAGPLRICACSVMCCDATITTDLLSIYLYTKYLKKLLAQSLISVHWNQKDLF